MSWVKLDDQFFRHSKARQAGKDGRSLFLAGLTYCASNLTDGFIHGAAVELIAAEAGVRPRVSEVLVQVGFWRIVDDGFVVHDYLDYQPSAEKVKAERTAAASRMKRRRTSPTPDAKETPSSSNVRANKKRSSPSPSPSLTDSPNGESLPPDPPRAELVAVPTSPPTAADGARALTCTFWESAEPKPAVKFIALLKLVERFLEAGWTEGQVSLALRETRAYTVDAITYSLRHRRETAAPAKPKSFDALQRRMAQHQAAEAGA